MEAHFGSSHEGSGIHQEPSCLRPGCNPPRKVREKMTIPLTDAFTPLFFELERAAGLWDVAFWGLQGRLWFWSALIG